MKKYIVRWLFEAKVYGLTDSEDNIFYIGCTTKSLNKRLIAHLSAARSYDSWRNSRKDEKIRSLDFKVKIKELHSFGTFGVDKREAAKNASIVEEQWIKKYLDMGVELCNCTEWKSHPKKGNKKVA